MNYKEIELYFQDEESLTRLLGEYTVTFERIEYYGELLRNGALTSGDEITSAMSEMVGIYENLNSVAMTGEMYKLNKEEDLAEKKRMQRATKLITSLAEEVKQVSIYRRIRNVFVSRRDACEKIISVFQSTLKNLDRERHLAK